MYRLVIYSYVILLAGCVSSSMHITQPKQSHDGVHIRQVLLNEGLDNVLEKNNSLTCYTEIINDTLKGVSCQSRIGFIVFSGGLQKDKFVFEKSNPLFSLDKARLVTDLLMIDLFKQYQIMNEYFVQKIENKTIISKQGKKVAEIKQ